MFKTILGSIAVTSSPIVAYLALPRDNPYVTYVSGKIHERIKKVEVDRWKDGDNTPKRIILVRHAQVSYVYYYPLNLYNLT